MQVVPRGMLIWVPSLYGFYIRKVTNIYVHLYDILRYVDTFIYIHCDFLPGF